MSKFANEKSTVGAMRIDMDVATYAVIDEMGNILKEYFDVQDAERYLRLIREYDQVNPVELVELWNGYYTKP